MNKITIKISKLEDAKFLLNIHNIHAKSGFNLSTDLIKFKDHIEWYKKKLKERYSKIYIGYKNKKKFGYVRFDKIKGNIFKVSIGNHPKFYGKKLGTIMLKFAMKKFISSCKPTKIISYVKKFNIRSQKCFLNNEFKNIKIIKKKELNLNKLRLKEIKIYEYKISTKQKSIR